jgi:hypothetical protein
MQDWAIQREWSSPLQFDFATMMDAIVCKSVTAKLTEISGRQALRVALTDDVTLNGKPDIDYVDMPTFAVLPIDFQTGTLSIDILSRLNIHAPDYARAFAGLAYHISDDYGGFESVYIRPLNGKSLNPPPPRDQRAIQYFAYPDWRYQRLRDAYPDGRYEAAADILPDQWTNLRLEIDTGLVTVKVDGAVTLVVKEPKLASKTGHVGLFVDIGTEAYFSNLAIESSTPSS